jgi:hypothetical protein
MSTRYLAVGLILSATALAACSSTQSTAPTGLQSSAQLQQDPAIHGAYIYRAPNVDTSKYRSLMIDPVAVYTGPEAGFSGFSQADQQRYAQIVDGEFRGVLGQRYRISQAPGPNVLRIKVTLLGVERTIGGVATATRVAPMGMAINAVRGVAGAGGSMTGAIELAIEAFDSQSNQLLVSVVRQQAPAVFDFESTLSTSDTVHSAARAVADELSDGIAKRAPQMAER